MFSWDYVCGLKRGDTIPTCDNLSNLFDYFNKDHTDVCETQVLCLGRTGAHSQRQDGWRTGRPSVYPLEMLIFNLTVHHIWGRVLPKFQGIRTVDYVDDGYIEGKMSVTLQLLTGIKRVLKEDAGLELNISKTVILPKAITQQDIFDVVNGFINTTPSRTKCHVRVIR